MRAFSCIVLHYTSNLAVLYTFAVVFGFVDYSVVPPVISLTQETLGEETMGYVFDAMGYVLDAMGYVLDAMGYVLDAMGYVFGVRVIYIGKPCRSRGRHSFNSQFPFRYRIWRVTVSASLRTIRWWTEQNCSVLTMRGGLRTESSLHARAPPEFIPGLLSACC